MGPATRRPLVNAEAGEHSLRPRLTRTRIVSVATELIDIGGVRAFTMRRLSTALGVQAMVLYGYVPGREAMLTEVSEAMVDHLYREVEQPARSRPWPLYLAQIAQGVRANALAHGEIFGLLATRPADDPRVRRPLSSLAWLDAVMDTLMCAGFGAQAAVAAYDVFCAFLLGQITADLTRSPTPTAEQARLHPESGSDRDLQDLQAFRRLRTVHAVLTDHRSLTDFNQSLHAVTEQLAAGLER